ncbi:MAG: cheR [Clostridiales bacterium]|jgi:chemotaxis protein methyltransferase CheR|nr:cheR [Clostridiales bacterium]
MFEDYEGFKTQILQLTSIDLNAYKERQMRRRIESLIKKSDISDYEPYVHALKKDKALFDEFVNYLTINVSEFYRNPEQWRLLENDILPQLFGRFGNKLKIWSAACSTGDEPYSLVMLLSKFLPLNQIKVIATDIDKEVLDKARMGMYNPKSLEGLPEEFKKKYFKQISSTAYQISDDIKKCVEFKQHNLLKDEYIKECDLLVCRNVLIYFTDEAKNDIFSKFHKSLKKEGILFLGSTEQIMQPQQYNLKLLKSFFYIKE